MFWLRRLILELFGSSGPSGRPYVWRRRGITRATSESVEKWGRFGVDQNVYKVRGLSSSAKEVYVYLSRVADADGYSFPFLHTIAKRTKLSKSTVGKALNELENAGMLQIERRYSRRGGSSNLYHLRKVADVYPEIISPTPEDRSNKN
ncbi:MAG: helix-turn-helix domain-containing protein [Candidatus Binatia bacterium]